MYELNEAEKSLIDTVKLMKGENPAVSRFVKRYELNPANFTKRGSKIRYLISKKGFTLGKMENLLGLKGGSISLSSQSKNDKVDAYLERLLDTPVSELRDVPKKETTRSQLISIAKTLRTLADILEEM